MSNPTPQPPANSSAPSPNVPPSAVTAPADDAMALREGAQVNPEVVHVTSEAAVKENSFPSRPGYPSGMASMCTHLHVEAWVRNATFAKNVWVDVELVEREPVPFHSETLPLGYTRPAGDGGDLFVVDAPVYQGMVATPGSVEPRPDARVVHYRLYAELNGDVYTDGAVHHCYLKPDSATH